MSHNKTPKLTEREKLQLQLVAAASCQKILDELSGAGVDMPASSPAMQSMRTSLVVAEIDLRHRLNKYKQPLQSVK